MAFDPSIAQKGYTEQEWAMKTNWYQTELAKITIPAINPTPADLQSAVVMLDRISSTAFIDAAYTQSACEKYELLMKIEEGNAYVSVQNGQVGNALTGKAKLSIDDTKALVKSFLSSNNYNGMNYNIYQLVITTKERWIFMSDIIEMIKSKKDMFITTAANLKIDASLSGMTPSVPNQPKQSQAQISYQANRRSDYGDVNG